MKIVSLSSYQAGNACAVATVIKRDFYNNDAITNIFDYLEISIESINEMHTISENDIQHIDFHKETITKHEKGYSVLWKHFHHIYSHHDLHNIEEKDWIELKEKYIRRYRRWMDMLRNEEEIFFLRYGKDETYDQLYLFFENIKKKNPHLIFHFIHLFDSVLKNPIPHFSHPFYQVFYFESDNENYPKHQDLYERTLQYDWTKIKEWISEKVRKK